MTANKKVFAITGPTGSGKGYVSQIFKRYGVHVFDADKIAHMILCENTDCKKEIVSHFGENILTDSIIDRKKLSKLVFSDKKELDILTDITHKYIKKDLEEKIKNTDGIIAIDGAVILTSPVLELCSFVVSVICPFDVRLERIKKRDGISKTTALDRMNSQPLDEFYIKNSKYVINNAPENKVSDQVKDILEREFS